MFRNIIFKSFLNKNFTRFHIFIKDLFKQNSIQDLSFVNFEAHITKKVDNFYNYLKIISAINKEN